MTLTISILGRPNVGKSTLFNRLAGKKLAIVDDSPGVTRDRRLAIGNIGDLEINIIDTAGYEEVFDNSLEGRMQKQANQAIKESDLVLFLIDSRAGITSLDTIFSKWIRTQDIPIILIANKYEGPSGDHGFYESYKLGLGDPIAISAEHGDGLADLYQAIAPHHEDQKPSKITKPDSQVETELDDFFGPIQLAIVGRPNVGKSTLVNQLLGEERVLTGPEAGITRDAISINWQYEDRAIKLIDTAGLRRKSKVTNKIESLSALDSHRAIQYAQIVVLVLDSNDMLEKQDLTIARKIIDEGRILIIAANKWDLIDKKKVYIEKLNDRLKKSLPQVTDLPTVLISALTGKNIDKLILEAFKLFKIWNRRIQTAKLNQWLLIMTERHPPPLSNGRRIRIRYITQVKTRPPTFVIFSSKGNQLPESYRRFLINGLRIDFNLPGVPIRLLIRTGSNPYNQGLNNKHR